MHSFGLLEEEQNHVLQHPFEEGKTNGGVQCRLLSLTSENQDIPERTSQMAYRCLWGYGIEADLIVGARCYQFFSDVVERDGWGFEV